MLHYITKVGNEILTGRNSTAKQGHGFEGSQWVKLENTGGIKHSVLRKCGSVEEMIDRVPILCGKPTLSVINHRTLQGIHPIIFAQVGLLGFAVGAVPAFPVEDWYHVVSRFQIPHPFSHALNHTAVNILFLIKSNQVLLRLRYWRVKYYTIPRGFVTQNSRENTFGFILPIKGTNTSINRI